MSLKNTATAALTALALSGGPAAQAERSSITPRPKSATVEYTQTQAKAVQYVLKRNSKLATLLHQYPSAHSDQFWTAFGEYLDDTGTNAKVAEIIATSGDCNEFRPKNFKTLPKKEKRHFIKNPTPDYKECKELYRPRLNAKDSALDQSIAEGVDANQRKIERIQSKMETIANQDAQNSNLDHTLTQEEATIAAEKAESQAEVSETAEIDRANEKKDAQIKALAALRQAAEAAGVLQN